METAIVSVICIGLILFGGMTMSRGFITSVDSTTAGLEESNRQGQEIMRTRLSAVSAAMVSAAEVDARVANTGETKLADFDRWDVIVQYHDGTDNYQVVWVPYTAGAPGNNEWTVAGIYLNGEAESFEPEILNPGEELRIEANLMPPVGTGTTNQIVISTPNGIAASQLFSY